MRASWLRKKIMLLTKSHKINFKRYESEEFIFVENNSIVPQQFL